MLTKQRFALLFKNLFAVDMTLCQLRPRRLTIKTGRHQNFPKYVFGTYRKPKSDAFNTSTSFPLSIFASHKCRKTNSAVVDCFHTSNHIGQRVKLCSTYVCNVIFFQFLLTIVM